MIFEPNKEDKELIEGCLEGNRISQKKLFEKYKDSMYTVAFRIIRDEDLAYDALQDAFMKIFKGIHSFKGLSTLGAWIKTITVRSAYRYVKLKVEFDDLDQVDNDAIIEWDDNLTGELLDKAIAGLSPGYRLIFLLNEVEGYTHREISQLLEISEGTSKSQLSRAKMQLQNKLQNLRN